MKRKDAGEPIRGSREATLGTEGLRVSTASGTVPATAPDDNRPPVYADSKPEIAAEEEFHASREANLGGSAVAARPAGGLVPEDRTCPRGTAPGDPEPEREWARESGND